MEDDSTARFVNGLTARVADASMAVSRVDDNDGTRVSDELMAVSRVDDDDGTRVADASMARVDAIYSSNSLSMISKGFGSTGRAEDGSTGRDKDDSTGRVVNGSMGRVEDGSISRAKDGSIGRVVDGTTGHDDFSLTRVDRRPKQRKREASNCKHFCLNDNDDSVAAARVARRRVDDEQSTLSSKEVDRERHRLCMSIAWANSDWQGK